MAKARSSGATRKSVRQQSKAAGLSKPQRKVVRQTSNQARRVTRQPARGAARPAPKAGGAFQGALGPAMQQRLQQMQAARAQGGRQLGMPGQPMQRPMGGGFGGGGQINPAMIGALRQAMAQRGMGMQRPMGQGFGVGGVPPGFQRGGQFPGLGAAMAQSGGMGGSFQVPGGPLAQWSGGGGTATRPMTPELMARMRAEQMGAPSMAGGAMGQGMVDQDPATPGFQFTPQHLQTIGQIALAGTPLAGTFGPAAQKAAASGQSTNPLAGMNLGQAMRSPQMQQAAQFSQAPQAGQRTPAVFDPARQAAMAQANQMLLGRMGGALPGAGALQAGALQNSARGSFGPGLGQGFRTPIGPQAPAPVAPRPQGTAQTPFGRQLGAALRRGI